MNKPDWLARIEVELIKAAMNRRAWKRRGGNTYWIKLAIGPESQMYVDERKAKYQRLQTSLYASVNGIKNTYLSINSLSPLPSFFPHLFERDRIVYRCITTRLSYSSHSLWISHCALITEAGQINRKFCSMLQAHNQSSARSFSTTRYDAPHGTALRCAAGKKSPTYQKPHGRRPPRLVPSRTETYRDIPIVGAW